MLELGANVDQDRAGCRLGIEFVPLDRAGESVCSVQCHIAEHVHRVLRGRELRGVRQLEVGEFGGKDASGHRRRDHIDPLVDSVAADALRSEDLVGAGVDHQLERHRRGARVVPGVGRGMRVNDANVAACCAQQLLVPAGGRDGETHQTHDGGAERVAHPDLLAADRVRDETAVTIRESGERDEALLPRDRIGLLDRVADRIDRRVAGAQLAVDADAAALTEGEARGNREGGLGPDADRREDEFGRHGAAVAERCRVGSDLGHLSSEPHIDSCRAKSVGDRTRHLGVEGWEHLVAELHERDLETATHEVLDHLEPDESGADHQGGARGGIELAHGAVDILDVTQRQHPLSAGNRRANGRGTRGEHERVVALDGLFAGEHVADADGLGIAVDRCHLAMHAHIEAETGAEGCGRLEQQALTLFDDAAEVVRKSAVGERDVATALENEDLGVFDQAAEAGRGGHAARDAADDDDALCAHDPTIKYPRGYIKRGLQPCHRCDGARRSCWRIPVVKDCP